MEKPITTIVVIFLILISLLHVLRLVLQVPVTIGASNIPIWASIFGSVVPGALAVLLKRENTKQ